MSYRRLHINKQSIYKINIIYNDKEDDKIENMVVNEKQPEDSQSSYVKKDDNDVPDTEKKNTVYMLLVERHCIPSKHSSYHTFIYKILLNNKQIYKEYTDEAVNDTFVKHKVKEIWDLSLSNIDHIQCKKVNHQDNKILYIVYINTFKKVYPVYPVSTSISNFNQFYWKTYIYPISNNYKPLFENIEYSKFNNYDISLEKELKLPIKWILS